MQYHDPLLIIRQYMTIAVLTNLQELTLPS
jgi:hypothetical protein